MAAKLTHIALNADDVDASRRFYAAVFGWQLEPWGPPGFLRMEMDLGDAPTMIVALQSRRDLLGGLSTFGAECTFAVDDVAHTRDAVIDAGGRMLMEPSSIPGVGRVIAFEDPGGNPVLAMEYDQPTD